MKIQWKQSGQTIDTPSLAFGFDTVAQVIEGRVVVSWYKEGALFKHGSNLVISDYRVSNLDIAQTIANSADNYSKHRKGDEVDGTARDVYPIINDPRLPFRAGLTVHAARGTWSSLPHKFEAEEILTPRPMPFYEQFAYVTDPPGGWGVQIRIGYLYGLDNEWQQGEYFQIANDTVVIRDRDITNIPLGSHPVVAAPGSRLMYFWCYWSDGTTADQTMRQREKF